MNIPKTVNRLINETSPYLLQHAYNPVEWFAWSEAAFAKVKAEDKPIMVSIGYSARHWCHIIEHESFEDAETARIMNEHFVNIKIDLEERPDVDRIYMKFVQVTTGSGGYQLNVFLTIDKLPFFGGTYFPPLNRFNMTSFQRVLLGISEARQNNRDELLASGQEILSEMQSIGGTESSASAESRSIGQRLFESFRFVRCDQRRFRRRAEVSAADVSGIFIVLLLSNRRRNGARNGQENLATKWLRFGANFYRIKSSFPLKIWKMQA